MEVRPHFRGLAFRIGSLVFVACLVTSLLIAWLSVRSLEDFLHARVDRKFPELLQNAGAHLQLWYRERGLDLEVFARNPVLTEGLADPGPAARGEVQRYLAYLLESSPQYASLAVVDRGGKVRLQAGEQLLLPAPLLGSVARASTTQVSGLVESGPARLQVVSTSIPGQGRTLLLGTLRLSALQAAVVEIDAADAVLGLVDAAGEPVVGELRSSGTSLERALASTGATVLENGGERTVVAASAFRSFGWTLVVEEPYELAFAPVGEIVRRAFTVNLLLVLLSSGAAFALGARRVQPVVELAQGARRLAEGEAGVRVDERHARDEVLSLAHSFNEMAERLDQSRRELESRNRELVSANEVLEQLSITDGLTRLHNHRHFQDQFAQEVRRAQRTGASFCLVLLDIDDFKALNDRMGHSDGDRVLEAVAHIMSLEIRETDYLARYGGEEFAVLLPDTEVDGAVALAEKLRMAVGGSEIPVAGPDGTAAVTVSVGVAAYRESADATFVAADRALYEAKAAGKDCVQTA